MNRPAAPLPGQLAEVFSRREAQLLGIHDNRLRRRDVERVFQGVYRLVPHREHQGFETSGEGRRSRQQHWAEQHLVLARAYAKIMHGEAFFAGRTAALLWALPVPLRERDEIEVGRFLPAHPPRAAGIEGVRLARKTARVTTRGGLRVLTPVSIWASMGARLALPDLVAMGDALIRVPRMPGGFGSAKQGPMATASELHSLIAAGRRVGNPRLRNALTLLRTGSSSAPESHLRLALIEAGLPEPELDRDVYDRSGRFLGCSELTYVAYKLAIEYESEHHRVDQRQWNRDIQKYQDYAEAGWQVIRVTARLLYRQRAELVRQVETALRARGWRP